MTSKSRLIFKRWIWFIALYLISIVVVFSVSYLIRKSILN